MAFDRNLVLGIFVVCLSIKLGTSMKCFACSSFDDELCGTTWGYEADSTKYLQECVGEKTACKKLEYNNELQGGIIVTRSCWNTTDLVHEFEMKCEEIQNGNVCYCEGKGDDPCNGGQLVHPHSLVSLILTGLSSLLLTVMYLK